MTEETKNYIKRTEVERYEDWGNIRTHTPSINFKQEWGIKIIPPFGGAVARFLVMKGDTQVCSVYLDWNDKLGCVGQPYYELYPFDNDVKRYLLDETDELVKDIDSLFNE